MPNYEQLPGDLGLTFRRGDLVSTEIDFNPISLSGLTMSAAVTSLVSGAAVATVTTSFVDAAAGRLNVSLTAGQTSAMPPGTYRWLLTGTDGTSQRSYLTGFVEVTP